MGNHQLEHEEISLIYSQTITRVLYEMIYEFSLVDQNFQSSLWVSYAMWSDPSLC
jgi:hypothetical protein